MKILVIQLTRLGDIIQSIPLMDDLKKKYPKSDIFLLINDLFSESKCFLSNCKTIPIKLEEFIENKGNEYILHKNKYFQSLMNNLNIANFDLVINLNNTIIAKHILDYLKYKKLLGFRSEHIEWTLFNISFLKSRKLSSINLVDIFRRFLDSEYKATPLSATTTAHKSKKIAIQCGARNPKRKLTEQQCIDIANFYLNREYTVYLLGTEPEKEAAKKIMQSAEHDNLIDMTGKTNLAELYELISSCMMVYTPDTATMHIAALCNTFFTTLFCGAAYPHETLAYTNKAIVYMPNSDFCPCYPCDENTVCTKNFRCKNLDFKKIFANEPINEFTRLSVQYDEIGQFLTPIDELAKLWREFAHFYFYQKHDHKTVYRKIHITPATQELIRRELKIFYAIDINEVNVVRNNFTFLTPLLYYNRLSSNKQLLTEALRYWETVR